MSAGALAQHGSSTQLVQPDHHNKHSRSCQTSSSPQPPSTLPPSAAWLCNETPRSSPGAGQKGRQEHRLCGVSGAQMLTLSAPPCLGWLAETCCVSGATNLGPINHDFCSTPNPLELDSPQHVTANCVTAQRFRASFDGIFGFPAELFSLPPGMRSSSQS